VARAKAEGNETEEDRHERAIRSLADRCGVGVAEVRTRFRREFARLAPGASVRSFLTVLTAANVLSGLRRERGRERSGHVRRSA